MPMPAIIMGVDIYPNQPRLVLMPGAEPMSEDNGIIFN